MIPRATGPLRSRPVDEIRDEVQRLVEMGAQKILLAGEDVGAYGQDCGLSLGRLLDALLALRAEFELVVESINPQWLTAVLGTHAHIIADARISDRWYVPVQAATDRMLNLMRRPYSMKIADAALARLRKLRPNAYVITDLISGHPGERHADVMATADFFARHRIDYLEAMSFDAHPGTVASGLPNQVDEAERTRRTEFVISAFLAEWFRRLDLRDGDAVSAHLTAVERLPINTNLSFAGRMDLTGLDELTGVVLGADVRRQIVRSIPPPRAVALDPSTNVEPRTFLPVVAAR